MIKTLSDAVTIVEFLMSHQGKSVEDAIKEANVPLHFKDQVLKYFSPPLEILPPDLIVDNKQQLPKCNPENDSTQQYFGALQRFLIEKGRPKAVIGSLSQTSLNIVRRFPKPEAADKFQVRGLVLGYIQSGKTASMAALIARAADEGYKLFIVLGGFWKDLRSQTQSRLDQEIAGHSDDPKDGPFVIHDAGLAKWVRFTSSGLDGDFNSGGPNDLNPATPKLAVIKKNKKIEALTEWLKKSPVPLKNLPALVIDDEADQGSIDTNYGKTDEDGERIDPSATNRRIRNLLSALPKCVYVGYTATPFANVLIDSTAEEDLYPRDFIVSLPEPAGYFGPRKLFGLGLEPSDLSPASTEKPGLDVIRPVNESDLEEIDRALAYEGNDCPKVLSDALLAFVLSSCGRCARGQEKEHFSMLVHPSQKTEPHQIFASAIRKELELLRAAAAYPKKFPDLMRRAGEMWKSDFLRVTKQQNDPQLKGSEFETVWKFARPILESIEIKVLNINSEDKLEYKTPARRYIVVGGNKLSRGLTLEGLSVSIFTRSANQYDTLLQMGRWFGYRPGYADLTRIYVDPEMADRFAELARVEDELRADIRKYAQEPNPPTPLDLKPIIRRHPALSITSKSKMGAGKVLTISFQNTSSETVSFPIGKNDLLNRNIESGKALISQLSGVTKPAVENGTYTWKDVPASVVTSFFESYEFSRDAREVNRSSLVNYVRRQNEKGELTKWDIVLPRGNQQQDPFRWAEDVITHRIQRSPLTATSVRQLKSPGDIDAWRSATGRDPKDPSHGALVLYMVDGNSQSPEGKRFFQNAGEAVDLLGLVIVFPESKSNATVEYISQ